MPASETAEGGRREQIFHAAARLFHERGYTATSIKDVADEVGMLKGSIYYHIDSKEQLLFDIIRSAHEHSLSHVRRLRESDRGALEVLEEFIVGHVAANAENLASMGVFFHDFRHLSEEHRDEIIAERDEYDEFVRALIDRGKTDGTVDPQVDTVVAATGVMGMMNWVYQWYRPSGPDTPEQVGRAIAGVAIRGLATPS